MKLLAALPFAAPVVAKEVAASKFARGGPFLARMELVAGEVIWTSHGGLPAPLKTFGLPRVRHFTEIDVDREHDFGQPMPQQPNEALRALLCGPARSDTPNRLYGVRINSDGDAV